MCLVHTQSIHTQKRIQDLAGGGERLAKNIFLEMYVIVKHSPFLYIF